MCRSTSTVALIAPIRHRYKLAKNQHADRALIEVISQHPMCSGSAQSMSTSSGLAPPRGICDMADILPCSTRNHNHRSCPSSQFLALDMKIGFTRD